MTAHVSRVCTMFAQLGLRGVSVLVSSGDNGVGGSASNACVQNDGSGTRRFIPTFPASCPLYVTMGLIGLCCS